MSQEFFIGIIAALLLVGYSVALFIAGYALGKGPR
jgi:hypothetical protein